MNGFLYILWSETSGQYYVGSCIDPARRLIQHNSNAVASTRGKGPWLRVALVEFETPTNAKRAESFIKRQKSRKIIELVISGEFIWPTEFSG